jgi:hypothetical protein
MSSILWVRAFPGRRLWGWGQSCGTSVLAAPTDHGGVITLLLRICAESTASDSRPSFQSGVLIAAVAVKRIRAMTRSSCYPPSGIRGRLRTPWPQPLGAHRGKLASRLASPPLLNHRWSLIWRPMVQELVGAVVDSGASRR